MLRSQQIKADSYTNGSIVELSANYQYNSQISLYNLYKRKWNLLNYFNM